MLRTRLMLGLLLLLIILLLIGLYSIYRSGELGKRIETLGKNDDATGRNLVQMKHSCSTTTGALLNRLAGDSQMNESEFNAAVAEFDQALHNEQAQPNTTAEERDLIGKLVLASRSYQDRARLFLHNAGQSNPILRSNATRIGDCTENLLSLVDQLGVVHQQARNRAERDGADDTLVIFLMIIAFLATILAWMGINRGLVDPLRSLTASIQQVGAGNLDQKVPVLDNYELGTLARSFNQMAEQLKLYRVNASEELTRLNLTIRATLASFPDPIFVLNSQGAVEFRNPEADQLAVQLLFSGVTRLPKKVDDKVEHVRLTGQDYLPTLFQEAIKFHLNGQDRYFLPRIVLLRDDNRQTFGVAVILENVTRMLLLDDVKSNLISTVSHELKTPLTSVRMALYLLYEKTVGELNDKQMDLVVTAREDADRLLRTLNDLLDLAKLEQGPSQLALRQISPRELVETAARSAKEAAQAARVRFVIRIAEDLPDVQVDEQRMAYVFSNLITNALKYGAEGGQIELCAELGRNRSNLASVRFSVLDQGPGISPDHQEHIFERFYRIPGSKKSGAGLGLSIAREIVVAHQGEMGMISGSAGGSEFFFVLPIAA